MSEPHIRRLLRVADILSRVLPARVKRDVPLSSLGTWRIGGLARVVVSPGSVHELRTVLRILHEEESSAVVLGAGTNLLFPDEGLDAVAIRMVDGFQKIRVESNVIHVSCGTWVPWLALTAMRFHLTGAEHLSGIPGTVGGLICMNGGSLRKSIGGSVVEVVSVDGRGRMITRLPGDCGFGYRRSIFQYVDETIISAKLQFEPSADNRIVRRQMLEILRARRLKFPRKLPNCGSVFTSNSLAYANHGPPGMIFEKLGLKGARIGGACISRRHANFIINDGGATAADVLGLIAMMKSRAKEELNVDLACEVKYVSSRGRISSADQADAGVMND